MPPPKRMRPTTGSNMPQRMQTPMRDDLKLNQDEAMIDSNWEKSSLASHSQIDTSVQGGNNIQFFLQNLPQPKHSYAISEDQIMAMEEEITK